MTVVCVNNYALWQHCAVEALHDKPLLLLLFSLMVIYSSSSLTNGEEHKHLLINPLNRGQTSSYMYNLSIVFVLFQGP